MTAKPILLFDTLKHLKLIQIYALIRSKILVSAKKNQSVIYHKKHHVITPLEIVIPELDLDEKYYNRFKPDLLLKSKFTFLNETQNVDLSSWIVPGSSHLWNYNLHYFEFGISLGALYYQTKDVLWYKTFKNILRAWIKNNGSNYNDAWKPYTISLRIPNLFISLELFGNIFKNDKEFKQEVEASIYEQYIFLEKNKELHLLGNHYFENIKTCILCNIVFGEREKLDKNITSLKKQIKEQVLPDGMHFECSIMYHKIILEGLMRTAFWVRQVDRKHLIDFVPIIQKMIDCLVSLEKGMGKMPLFNDAGDGVARETYQLISAAKRLYGLLPQQQDLFVDAGYAKIYSQDIAVMFDSGKIGPDYMPGHGHCDALSFELSKSNEPIFVNSGTYQYQGELRSFFRSTESHNTIVINGEQQSECWGEHRVARRISHVNIDLSIDRKSVKGSYMNYNGSKHQRKIGFCAHKVFLVVDRVLSRKNGIVQSFIHIHPNYSYIKADQHIEVVDNHDRRLYVIYPIDVDDITIHKEGYLSMYANEFGCLHRKESLEMRWSSDNLFSGYYIAFQEDFMLTKEIMKHFTSWCNSLENY
ncbi:MAG: alginate lyase family protein [Tissierellia bacterium]|nr:alginate lyase family protein [Tissierellia bacterium]